MSGDDKKKLNLKVAKAIPSDVGHGRARVPFDNELNLKPGDIIEIKGDDTTAAIVWRAAQKMRISESFESMASSARTPVRNSAPMSRFAKWRRRNARGSYSLR